jgi:hypothetical protein
MPNKYIELNNNGILKQRESTSVSTGVDNAGDIVALNNLGKIDGSLLPAGNNSYQKYFIQSTENYSIPLYTSSVVSGPFISEGPTEVLGRLEII